MRLEKIHDYVFRIGSDNQHRLHWEGGAWHYEFLAGGVMFDERSFETELELVQALESHGLTLDLFSKDKEKISQTYSAEMQHKTKMLEEKGVVPCPKHGYIAKNEENICEACANTDQFDDHKGSEG